MPGIPANVVGCWTPLPSTEPMGLPSLKFGVAVTLVGDDVAGLIRDDVQQRVIRKDVNDFVDGRYRDRVYTRIDRDNEGEGG